MKRLQIVALCAAAVALALTGCATKTRNVELSGMYVSEAGTLAIGNVEVQAAPVGEESAMIRYEEDTAWLSPSTKTHSIKIMLTGTNSVASAGGIVRDVCDAFKSVGVSIAQVNAGMAVTNGSTTVVTNAMDKIVIDPSPAPTAALAAPAASTNDVQAVAQ